MMREEFLLFFNVRYKSLDEIQEGICHPRERDFIIKIPSYQSIALNISIGENLMREKNEKHKVTNL